MVWERDRKIYRCHIIWQQIVTSGFTCLTPSILHCLIEKGTGSWHPYLVPLTVCMIVVTVRYSLHTCQRVVRKNLITFLCDKIALLYGLWMWCVLTYSCTCLIEFKLMLTLPLDHVPPSFSQATQSLLRREGRRIKSHITTNCTHLSSV